MSENLAGLEETRPGTVERILRLSEAEQLHDHRMDWAEFCFRMVGLLAGIGTVVVFAIIATHYIDRGQGGAGLALLGFWVVGVVGVFMKVRIDRGIGSRREPDAAAPTPGER